MSHRDRILNNILLVFLIALLGWCAFWAGFDFAHGQWGWGLFMLAMLAINVRTLRQNLRLRRR